jgi:coenzyme F420-reducing hydrogenase delta subunit
MSSYEPKLVCFSCKFGWGYLNDEDALAKQIKNWVPIICSGKVDSSHILNAFRQGADGVLILGCRGGDCHYQDGNY